MVQYVVTEEAAMRECHIDVRVQSAAGPDEIYRLLADGSTWPRWAPIESLEVERAGDAPPEGVGAIRVLRRGRTTGRDEILELVPGRRVKYATLSGLPIRDYVGQVDLEPVAGGGTSIHWHSSFRPKYRGTGRLLERGIGTFLEQCAKGLADYAARSSDVSRP
jgi:hypothetical protein